VPSKFREKPEALETAIGRFQAIAAFIGRLHQFAPILIGTGRQPRWINTEQLAWRTTRAAFGPNR
jgi:hypothetical protein